MQEPFDTNRLDLELRDVSMGRDHLIDAAKLASKRGIGGVWVYPSQVLKVAQALSMRSTQVVAGVGCPMGMSKSTIKAIEVTSCIKEGATRIEVWLNAEHSLRIDTETIRSELLEIARAARAANPHVELFAAIEFNYPYAFARFAAATREGAFDGISMQNFGDAESIVDTRKHTKGLKLKVRANGSHLTVTELFEAGADIVGVEQF